MDELWTISASVLGVFLVMLIGGLGRWLNWLTRDSDRSLASFIANVLLPCLFFDRLAMEGGDVVGMNNWVPPLFGFACTCGGFLLAYLFARFVGPFIGMVEDSTQRTFALCVGIANYGFIPLPLATQFYPDAYNTLLVHNVGVDLALWTVGIFLLTGGTSVTMAVSLRRALLSPPLLAWGFAMLVRFGGWVPYVPAPIAQATHALGECLVPMGLVLSGAIIVDYLARFEFRKSWHILVGASALRLLCFPVLILLSAALFPVTIELSQVLLLQAAMPVATFTIVITQLYGRDVTTAVGIVVGTSLLGILTIPAWMVIGSYFLGLG
jgi:predicted permease